MSEIREDPIRKSSKKSTSTKSKKSTSIKSKKEKKNVNFVKTPSNLFTHGHQDTRAIWTSETDGRKITIGQDVAHKKQNSIAELASSVGRNEGVPNENLDALFKTSINAIDQQIKSGPLDNHGKVLARDAENLLQSFERLLLEKNKDGRLQVLVGEGARTISKNVGVVKNKNKNIKKEKVKGQVTKQGKTAYDYMRKLAITFVQSGDLRELTTESVNLFKEVAGSTTNNVSTMQPTTGVIGASQPPIIERTEKLDANNQPYILERTIITKPANQSGSPVGDLGSRERMVDTFLNILSRLGQREEYRRAVKDSFKLYDSLAEKATKVDADSLGIDTGDRAQREARKLAELFVGTEALAQFRRDSTSLVRDIRKDPQLSSLSTDFRKFVLYSLDNPNELSSPQKRQEANDLISRTQNIMQQGTWGSRFKSILDDFQKLLTNLKMDTNVRDINNQVTTFVKDFSLNNEGRPDLWVINDSVTQVKMILLPVLRAHLANIPIDRIDMASEKMDFVLEDMTFSAADILPDNFSFDVRNKMNMNLRDVEIGKSVHSLKLKVTHITPVMNNLKFYVAKKSGFKWVDYGKLDLALRGRGLSISIKWNLVSVKGQTPTLELVKVNTTLDDLYIRIHQAKHSFIDKIGLALFKGMIKKRITMAVNNAIVSKITVLDTKINAIFAQRPLQKIVNTADSMVKTRYIKNKEKSVRLEKEKKRGKKGGKAEVREGSFMDKVKRSAQKAAKGIDTIAPTNLSGKAAPAPAPAMTGTGFVPSSSFTTGEYIPSGTSTTYTQVPSVHGTGTSYIQVPSVHETGGSLTRSTGANTSFTEVPKHATSYTTVPAEGGSVVYREQVPSVESSKFIETQKVPKVASEGFVSRV